MIPTAVLRALGFLIVPLLLSSGCLAAPPSRQETEAKLAPLEHVRRWAERAERVEAGQRIDVSPEALQTGIQQATTEVKEYLVVHPDDAGAWPLLARLGRAEIMVTPVFGGAQEFRQMEAKRRERVDQLAAYCDRALALDPNRAEAYYWKARLYGIRHFGIRGPRAAWVYVDLNLATQFARRAVELDPQNVDYREALAQYLFLNKQPDEAMNVMREVAGGKHPIYLLLMDQKALPLAPGATLLELETEDVVQTFVDRGWKTDFIPFRIRQYAVPMSVAEMETHYRRIWPQFQFFNLGPPKEGGGGKGTDYGQVFQWKEGALQPSSEKRELGSSCDDVKEGLRFNLTEFQNVKPHARFPIPVGNVFCVFIIQNCRLAMERGGRQ